MKSAPNKLSSTKDPLTKAMREQSTHQSIDTRITVYERLGLNKPGFWADWGDRRIKQDPRQAPDSEYSPTQPKIKPLPNFNPPQWSEEEEYTPPKFNAPNVSVMSAAGSTGTATGRTKKQLQQSQIQLANMYINSKTEMSPWISTSAGDVETAMQINMARQNIMYMEDHPSKMMSDATMAFYAEHPQGSAGNVMETHFEQITSIYSETKAKAAKKAGYAANQANKAIAKAAKAPASSAPRYNSPMLNIGKSGGYHSTTYFSTFG